MSQRTSAILWLIIALFCGFLSLVSCAGGGYATWYTHNKVNLLEQRIKDDEKEKDQVFVKQARLVELEKRLRESDKEKAEFERYRYFAIAGAAISVIPGLMTLVFLVMAVAKFMKKSRPASDDDEEDEEPPEKKPTPKAKAKPKDDDD
jgi:flagellar biosynthesis/type III secretory pathway M-ring protein FliF/YscJ